MSWAAVFSEPIPVPTGKQLHTLRQAGTFIQQLPETEAKIGVADRLVYGPAGSRTRQPHCIRPDRNDEGALSRRACFRRHAQRFLMAKLPQASERSLPSSRRVTRDPRRIHRTRSARPSADGTALLEILDGKQTYCCARPSGKAAMLEASRGGLTFLYSNL